MLWLVWMKNRQILSYILNKCNSNSTATTCVEFRESKCLDDVFSKFIDLQGRLEKKKNDIEFSIKEQYRKKLEEFVILEYQLQEKINDVNQVFKIDYIYIYIYIYI